MAQRQCGNCGAALPVENALAFVLETDVTNLAALLEGKLDNLACQICDTTTGVVSTLIAAFHEPDVVWLVPGSELNEEAAKTVGEKLALEFGRNPELLADAAALRREIVDRLKASLTVFQDYFLADERNRYLEKAWPRYRPAVFVASALALGGAIPGVQIAVGTREPLQELTTDDVLPAFAELQAKVWLALCEAWMQEEAEERGPTLESDLSRYVDGSLLLPGAREQFNDIADEIAALPDLPAEMVFPMEAVRASLYAVDGTENPRAGAWAEYFFGQELALYKNPERVSEKLRAMQISEERARRTIPYRAAWDAVVHRLKRALDESDRPVAERVADLEPVHALAVKAGHPHLMEDLMSHGIALRAPAGIPLQELVDPLLPLADRIRESGTELEVFDSLAPLLVRERRVDDLETLADIALREMGRSHTTQARVEAWLGRYLKEMREPRRFLERIGATPRAWEQALPSSVKLDLWVERSNALRLLGRHREALEVAQAALPLTAERTPKAQRTLRRNIAILLRETGAPDVALREFQALAEEAGNDWERLNMLESLATTYGHLAQMEQVLDVLEQALSLAIGPHVERRTRLQTSRASVLAWLGRHAEAVEALEAVPQSHNDSTALLAEFATWLNIFNADADLVDSDRFLKLAESVALMMQDAADAGDAESYLTGAYMRALFFETAEDEGAVELWLALYEAHEEEEVPQRPDALIWLAHHAYGQGKRAVGHDLLTQVPAALSAQAGGVQDLALAVDSARRLRRALDKAAEQILFNSSAGATFEDVRLIAELSRDAIGRARLGQRMPDNPVLLRDGLTRDVLQTLAPASGRLGVVEWVEAAESTGRFVTVINATGNVDSHWLELPDVDEERLLRRLRSRLMNWRLGNAGDPFDLPDWQELVSWLHAALEPYLDDGDHLVFIEPVYTAGMPWHVAAAPRWTASYSASWTTLLALRQRELRPVQTVGVVAVPLFNDGEEVTAAFTRSVEHARRLAEEHERRLQEAVGVEADKEALVQVLTNSDMIKLLCHGFAAAGEVSLVVSRNGALPPGNRAALAGEKGRPYRLAWHELQRLPSGPDTVFSAACSSGLATVAGLGERLGLYNALFPSGTRSLVAPWWDVVAEAVLPVADDAFERYLRREGSLAGVLSAACQEAAEKIPYWLAWALAIEGDWR